MEWCVLAPTPCGAVVRVTLNPPLGGGDTLCTGEPPCLGGLGGLAPSALTSGTLPRTSNKG